MRPRNRRQTASRRATAGGSLSSNSPTFVASDLIPLSPLWGGSSPRSQGTGKVDDIPEPLGNVFEEIEDTNTPPEPTLTRRAASYSDFYHVVRAQLARDGDVRQKKKGNKADRSWEALMLRDEASAAGKRDTPDMISSDSFQDQLLEASQQDYSYELGGQQYELVDC